MFSLYRKLFCHLLVLIYILSNFGLASAQAPTVIPDLEQEIFNKVNAHRKKQNLPPFEPCHGLEEAARSHSVEMATLDYFSHQSPNSKRSRVRQRIEVQSLTPQSVAENIFMSEGYPNSEVADFCLRSWLESPGHRKNIESTKYQYMGVGLARKGEKCFITQVFAGGDLQFERVYTDPAAPDVPTRMDRISAEIHALANRERMAAGLPALTHDPTLKAAADGHSKEMLTQGYFSHWSPNPGRSNVRARVNLEGADPVRLAENIYTCAGYAPEKVPALAVKAWMDSSAHRANILEPRHKTMGVGVFRKGDTYYITQDFSGDE